MDERVKKIVETLTKGTKEKKIDWERTDRDREYMVKLGNGVVTIDSWVGHDEDSGEDQHLADIGFLSRSGEVIDRVTFSSSEYKDYRELINLHDAARRNNLKVDQTLDEILFEIERKIDEL